MTSLLYPYETRTSIKRFLYHSVEDQHFSCVNFKSQWQMLLSRTEERIIDLRLINGLNSFQITLLRSGLNLLGLELEQVMLEDSAQVVPGEISQLWGSTSEVDLKFISAEIETAKDAVDQCCQSKLLTKYETSILLFGLRLLIVELDELQSIQCFSV